MQPRKSIAVESNSKRSFRNNIVIRRNYYCSNKCLLAVFIILLCFIYFTSSADKAKDLDSQAVSNHQPTKDEDFRVETAAEVYVRNYCNGSSGCQKKSAEALTSLLNLIAKEAEEKNKNEEAKTLPIESPKQQLSNRLQQSHYQAQSLIGKQLAEQQANDNNKKTVLSQIPLFVIKSPLVTTPNEVGFLNQLISFNKVDSYPSIDNIVNEEAVINNQWQPTSKQITIGVRSHTQIQPRLVELQLQNCKGTSLDLVGIIITIDSNIRPVKIGRYCITDGLTRISCTQPECEDSYDILMAVLPNCQVHKMRVFQSYQT